MTAFSKPQKEVWSSVSDNSCVGWLRTLCPSNYPKRFWQRPLQFAFVTEAGTESEPRVGSTDEFGRENDTVVSIGIMRNSVGFCTTVGNNAVCLLYIQDRGTKVFAPKNAQLSTWRYDLGAALPSFVQWILEEHALWREQCGPHRKKCLLILYFES